MSYNFWKFSSKSKMVKSFASVLYHKCIMSPIEKNLFLTNQTRENNSLTI